MSDEPSAPSSRSSSKALPPPRRPRVLGTTARRVATAIFLTAMIPLVAGTFMARAILARVSAIAFQPEFGAHLDQALGVYVDLVRALKREMRAEADLIAASPSLHVAAAARDEGALDAELGRAFAAHPSLVLLRVTTCDGDPLAERRRERPVDPAAERTLPVRRTLPPGGPCEGALEATFATPRARLDELEGMESFVQAYHQIEGSHREQYLDQTYANVFVALLGGTLLLSALVGALVVRPVTRRLARLSEATRRVAEGDLSVRVALAGGDEAAELGLAFDRMLGELAESRARVEFLKRMGEWQKMARRLAHEIKNPLTPIQLAVEECHRRYKGDDPEFSRVLQTTYEVVGEEVASLHRLVTEFSGFARLPRARLSPGDLAGFLREQATRFAAEGADPPGESALFAGVDVSFDVPDEPMPARLDPEMLHRVLTNVIRNAAQAVRDARRGERGRVAVAARAGEDGYEITIDDDGPGIPDEVASSIFDPYVTTKRDGTGLGLSIVKKIVVDHGGWIEAGRGPLGGARFRVVLPREGSPEALAAQEKGEPGPESIRAAGHDG